MAQFLINNMKFHEKNFSKYYNKDLKMTLIEATLVTLLSNLKVFLFVQITLEVPIQKNLWPDSAVLN